MQHNEKTKKSCINHTPRLPLLSCNKPLGGQCSSPGGVTNSTSCVEESHATGQTRICYGGGATIVHNNSAILLSKPNQWRKLLFGQRACKHSLLTLGSFNPRTPPSGGMLVTNPAPSTICPQSVTVACHLAMVDDRVQFPVRTPFLSRYVNWKTPSLRSW